MCAYVKSQCPLMFLILIAVVFAAVFPAVFPAVGLAEANTIVDFESGTVELASYSDQDLEPTAWQLTTDGYDGSAYALQLSGNTWKEMAISPQAFADSTVWQVAVDLQRRGEKQGLGISDGQNQLFYTFAGRDLPEETNWWTVYQGSYNGGQWHNYQLPVGEDWLTTFGYLPEVDKLIFVNDADAGTDGLTLFDDILDITGELPAAPLVNVLFTVASSAKIATGVYRLTIDFQGTVFDPDSDTFTFDWDFGDSTRSTEQNPSHEFVVEASYPYTVGLTVKDPEGLAGGDTCQIVVHTGDQDSNLTVNFVGDIFTGRGYENYGGLIATHGVEALFEPTLSIFGEAADVNVGNLEVSYTDRGTRHPTKSVVFRSRPENIVGIQYAGVDLVTLGNNHIIDYGEIGMLDTMDSLDDMQIPYCGAGVNEYFALQPAFWSEKGVRLAFLGMSNRTGRAWNYQPFLDAGYNKCGFGYLLPDNLEKSISYAKNLSDIVIVQTHSGDEYLTAPPADGKSIPQKINIEENFDGREMPDFKFRNEPTPGERELRRAAIDLGADILINHHPHVLQGFESYRGKLIAHSLGNFMFDLYYPETMPTMVLTLEMNKEEISGYRFTPAWINHWIPEPVSGNLSREIIDRLADYSRPMNAIVVPEPAIGQARIHLSRTGLDSTVVNLELPFTLVEEDGYQVSPPLELAGQGNLSQLLNVAGGTSGDWEISWGREILWHTGFEEEGSDFWDINTDDEWVSEDQMHSGKRSLVVRRNSSDSGQTGTDLLKHLPCDGQKRHSFEGWLKGDNTALAKMMARFYGDRYSETPLSSQDMGSPFTGTTDWTRQWSNISTPSSATYFEVRCGVEPPAEGEGLAWFDDIKFIEWEPWQPVAGALDIPAPNNFRYLQVRHSGSGQTAGLVNYRETSYGSQITPVFDQQLPLVRSSMLCYPNPFNPRTTVELNLPGDGSKIIVQVDVFDLRGRKVTALFAGELKSGHRHGFTWQGRDHNGNEVASGVYFCKATAGEQIYRTKMLLVR